MPNIGAAMPDGAAMAVVVWDAAGGALVTGGARDGATRAASVSGRRPPAAPVRVVVAAGSSLPPDLARPRELDRLRPWRGVADGSAGIGPFSTRWPRSVTSAEADDHGSVVAGRVGGVATAIAVVGRRPASLGRRWTISPSRQPLATGRRSPVSGRPPGGVRRRLSLLLAIRTSRRCLVIGLGPASTWRFRSRGGRRRCLPDSVRRHPSSSMSTRRTTSPGRRDPSAVARGRNRAGRGRRVCVLARVDFRIMFDDEADETGSVRVCVRYMPRSRVFNYQICHRDDPMARRPRQDEC